MKIYTSKSTAWGRVYFDPQSRQAVSIVDDDLPVVMELKEGYKPSFPDAQELDMPDDAFPGLVKAALRLGEVDMIIKDFNAARSQFTPEQGTRYALHCRPIARHKY